MDSKIGNFIVKGIGGFTFEFKMLDNGNIAFVRYQDDDREDQMTKYIYTGMYEKDDLNLKLSTIYRTLMIYAGHSHKMIKKVQQHFYNTLDRN